MELLIKASAAALIACVCVLLIKKSNPEIAYVLGVCSAVLMCVAAFSMFGEIIRLMHSVIRHSGLSPTVFLPIIKCVGIGMTVAVVSGFCKDAGQNALCAAVEYLGAAAAVFTALPLIETLLETMEGLL